MTDEDRLGRIATEIRQEVEQRRQESNERAAQALVEAERRARLQSTWRDKVLLLDPELAAINEALGGTGGRLEKKVINASEGSRGLGMVEVAMAGLQLRALGLKGSAALSETGDVRLYMGTPMGTEGPKRSVLLDELTSDVWRDWLLDLLELQNPGSA